MTKNELVARKAAAGAIYTGISQILKLFLSVASIIVIARLISPADFGIVAMVSPVIAFLLIFQDLGLNQAVIQRENVSDDQLSAMFWVNMMGACAAALCLLLIAPLVALFYGDPRVGYVTAAFSGNVVFGGLLLQHKALLDRQLRFARSSFIEVATGIGNFAIATLCAYLMRSYWALWLSSFLTTLINAGLFWLFVDWRPKLEIRLAETRGLIGFGAHVTVFNVVNFLSRNLDNILIAKVWGSYLLGLYDRSYKLMVFPLQNISNPLSRVMIPALSRLLDNPEEYRRVYLLAVRTLLIIIVPSITVAAATSTQTVGLLLGKQWVAAGPIFFWLCIALFPQIVCNSTGWVFISSGRVRTMMLWGMVSAAIITAAFVVGLRWGPIGVARTYAVVMVLIIPPVLFVWSTRRTPIRARDLYMVQIEPAIAGGCTWLTIMVLERHLTSYILILVSIVVSYSFAIGAQALTQAGRGTLKGVLKFVSGSKSVVTINE